MYLSVILLVSLMGITAACNQVPNDSQISTQLQDKLNADSGLQGKQLSVQAAKGVVTLSGNVDNDAQREAAARYAAAIPGVKEVVNNLQVGAPAPAAAVCKMHLSQQTAPKPKALTTKYKKKKEPKRDVRRQRKRPRWPQ